MIKVMRCFAMCCALAGCSQVPPFDGKGEANAVPVLSIPADLSPLKTLPTYQVPAALPAAVSAIAPVTP